MVGRAVQDLRPRRRLRPELRGLLQRIHPDDRERVTGLIANAVRTGVPLESEHGSCARTAPCGRSIAAGRSSPGDGSPVRLFGICQDITERKRIQDEVAIERELAFAVDGAPLRGGRARDRPPPPLPVRRLRPRAGMDDRRATHTSSSPPRGRPTRRSPPSRTRSKAMTFEEGSGLPGQAWAARHGLGGGREVGAEDVARVVCARGRNRRGDGGAHHFRGADRRRAGVLRDRARAHRTQAVSALVSRVATQLGPMLERKRAETALRSSEERFRLLLESVEDAAIVMLDENGNVASWNHAADVSPATPTRTSSAVTCRVSMHRRRWSRASPSAHLQQAAAEHRSSTPDGGCVPTACATAPRSRSARS